jgi:uncharacterized membrane protein
MESLIIMAVVLFLLTLGGMVLVLPVVAFIRTNRITGLQRRLELLEREVGELRRTPGRPEATVEASAPAEPLAEVMPVEAEPGVPPAPPAPAIAAPAPPRAPMPAFDLEDWIGRRGLGWVAVILLLFSTAFFLKYAFDNEWIGELGRVTIGVVAGVALCGAGFRYHSRGWRIFSQMLTAAGVVLLYLTTFASFGYYYLLPREHAAFFLVAIILEAGALAVLYDAPAIAIMALIGGYLNPILLRSGHDQYRNLFIYLALLDAGAVGLVLFRPWRGLGTLAAVGSHLLFWGWYSTWYHPEKMVPALVFQITVFLLFLAYNLVAHVFRSRRASIEDLVQLVLNPFLFAIAAYVLLDWDYHLLAGTFAVSMAAVYTAFGVLVLRRRPDDDRQLLVVIAVAMGFLAMAIPLQAKGGWISVGWAVQGAALLIFGMRIRSLGLRGMGTVLLALGVGRLLFVDLPHYSRDYFVMLPFMHAYGLSSLGVAACVWAVVIAGRRFAARLPDGDRMALIGMAVGGIALVWLLLSIESYVFVQDLFDRRTAQTTLSAGWAAYAVVLLGSGFRWRSPALRWGALGLFALTLAKVFLLDMASLPGFYRVAAFFVLSVMMGIAAWAYQRFQLTRLVSGAEGAEDDAI